MFNEEKFAQWDYCETCVSRDLDETEDPCARCILLVFDDDTKQPVNYVRMGDDLNV